MLFVTLLWKIRRHSTGFTKARVVKTLLHSNKIETDNLDLFPMANRFGFNNNRQHNFSRFIRRFVEMQTMKSFRFIEKHVLHLIVVNMLRKA